MQATQELRDEHEGITLMLKVLGVFAQKARNGKGFDKNQARRIIEFFKVFADKCHHGKEEEFLFPAMEQAGVPRQGGPLGVMLHEHDLGRGFVAAMSQALESGDDQGFAGAAENYIELLSAHIAKENNVLFRMADQVLSAARQEELAACFRDIESQRIGPGVHEAFHELMTDLAAQYLGGEK